ncbi:MAG: selenide, water dikinase SelD, partial [Bacteroidota bacterium]
SHGYGCGCKIAPAVLDESLKGNKTGTEHPGLEVGNGSRDDAAVLDLGNGMALISTTDFFMPIVDDAYTFGRIAATNAISDIFAMGGQPNLAVAILGWPVDKLPAEVASQVLAGGRDACLAAGIPLAGGHSIDSPEPIFGLAVNGLVTAAHLLRNDTARVGDLLFLTKPLGTGILTTAVKMRGVNERDYSIAVDSMCKLNSLGSKLGTLGGVHALTDVTGFGLFGHLLEMLEGSGLMARLHRDRLPVLPGVDECLSQHTVPAITYRNWNSYGHLIEEPEVSMLQIGCDPQTSGGLLIALAPEQREDLISLMKTDKVDPSCLMEIGQIEEYDSGHRIRFI